MVLQAIYTLVSNVIPSGYYWHVAISLAVVAITYAFAQGRTTDRERDLHARTILITGSFTPVGLTVISQLAKRGAHIIALSPYPLEHPFSSLLIPALRDETKNEHIYVEHADLSSPNSIREFCTKFLTGDDQRLDGIIFGHEFQCIGSFFGSNTDLAESREVASLATFLLTTLLLPTLLVAPVERDIRIVHMVNPFYAAASPIFTSNLIASMSPETDPKTKHSLLLSEGHRALRTVVFSRHLQRILNALPNRAPTLDSTMPSGAPSPPNDQSAAPPTRTKKDEPKLPSNIVSVTVCPGVSRTETVRALLGLENNTRSPLLLLLYLLLYPVIYLFAKSSSMATQTALHALFLPTPFKRALAHIATATESVSAESPAQSVDREANAFTEVVKPGALYRECSVVTLKVAPLPEAPAAQDSDEERKQESSATGKGKGKDNQSKDESQDDLEIEDDGEYGGEGVGRVVWEWYETRLKAWEAKHKTKEGVEKAS